MKQGSQSPIQVLVQTLRTIEPRVPGSRRTIVPASIIIAQIMGAILHAIMTGLFVLLIDISGSMDGEKLQQMITALLALFKEVPTIEIVVFAFDDQAHFLGTVSPDDAVATAEMRQKIAQLTIGGGTKIGKALKEALKLLRQRTGVRIVCVGSDGQTFDLPLCQQLVPEFVREEAVIHVVGTDDLDMGLAQQLTDATHGQLLFLKTLTATTLAQFFQQQVADAQRVVARNLRLALRLNEGVTLARASKSYPEVIPFGTDLPFEVRLGDLLNGDRVQTFVELDCPTPTQDAHIQVAEATVRYDLPQCNLYDQEVTVPVTVTFQAGVVPQAQPDTLMAFHQVKAHEEMARASQVTDPAQAIQLLESAQRRSQIVGDAHKTQVLEDLKSDIRRTHTVDEAVRKTAIAEARRTHIR